MSALHKTYSKVSKQHVYQIPKLHQIDPNLRQALQIFEELVSKFDRNIERYSANSFENNILEEFQRNIFDKSDYQHFLTQLTKALIKTIEVTINKI
jgi:hypothetical protein